MLFYAHRILKCARRCLLNVLNLYRPLRGSFLSNLALNVRKSHINQAKFLQAIFASLSSRKRSIFHLTYFLDRRTHLRQKSLLNLLHYQSLRLTSKIFKPNRGTRTTFLSNPLIFCSVFLRTSNIENSPWVLLNVLNLYRSFLGVFPQQLSFKCTQNHINQVKFLHATFVS